MSKHKKQHYIPSSYLQAWCDLNTPPGQTPYVWRFSKDGSQVNKETPKKIFYETDLYTIFTPDGDRDLHLETSLSKVESAFARLRRLKLNQKKALTSQEHLELCMFVAAMHSRTIGYAKYQSSQWQQVLDMAEKIQSSFNKATPEQRK